MTTKVTVIEYAASTEIFENIKDIHEVLDVYKDMRTVPDRMKLLEECMSMVLANMCEIEHNVLNESKSFSNYWVRHIMYFRSLDRVSKDYMDQYEAARRLMVGMRTKGFRKNKTVTKYHDPMADLLIELRACLAEYWRLTAEDAASSAETSEDRVEVSGIMNEIPDALECGANTIEFFDADVNKVKLEDLTAAVRRGDVTTVICGYPSITIESQNSTKVIESPDPDTYRSLRLPHTPGALRIRIETWMGGILTV